MFDKWGYAGGATDDWYSSAGIPYSYTWELPEADRYSQVLVTKSPSPKAQSKSSKSSHPNWGRPRYWLYNLHTIFYFCHLIYI